MSSHRSILLTLLLLALGPAAFNGGAVQAQDLRERGDDTEQISVEFTVQDIGAVYMPALLEGSTLYLPVADLFAYIRVRMDSVGAAGACAGFIADEQHTYRIDPGTGMVEYGGEEHVLAADEMRIVDDRLYLRSDLFGSLFGLHCMFEFRALAVKLQPEFELPAIRAMKREQAHTALHRRSGVPSTDRQVRESRSLFRPGVADWSILSGIDRHGAVRPAFSLALGGELLGGAMEAEWNGADTGVRLGDINWRWRYVDNDFSLLRQAQAGDLGLALPTPFFGKATGVSITNRPSIRPENYGTYVIENVTEPGWTVEMYIDGRLADYTVADASGHFRFDLPIRYGATAVSLKFFGPWGEQNGEETVIRIPHTFVPAGTVEYRLTGGLFKREGALVSEPFADALVATGIGSSLTFGGGVYALRGTSLGTFHPYLTATWRALDWALLSGRYSPVIGGEATLSLAFTSRASMDITASEQPRSADGSIYGTQRRLSMDLACPVDIAGTRGFWQTRVMGQEVAEGYTVNAQSTYGMWMFGAPITLGTTGEWSGPRALVMTSLRTSVRTSIYTAGEFIVRPSTEFDWQLRRFSSVGLDISRTIMNGLYADVAATRDLVSGRMSVQCGVQLGLPFARMGVQAGEWDGVQSMQTSASGSVHFDAVQNDVIFSDRSGLTRAALVIRPFLDVNNNEQYDEGEPLVAGMNAMVNGGTVRLSPDTVIRVFDMEAERPYVITLDDSQVMDISWRAKYRTWEVMGGANHFQRLDVPVTVSGEVSGAVVAEKAGRKVGLNGVLLRFVREDGSVADSTMTMDDGEFFFMGLAPGRYTIVPDADQMKRMGRTLAGAPQSFELRAGIEGDVVERVEVRVK